MNRRKPIPPALAIPTIIPIATDPKISLSCIGKSSLLMIIATLYNYMGVTL